MEILRGIRSYCDILRLCKMYNFFLNEIWVNFKLKNCGANSGVTKKVNDQ